MTTLIKNIILIDGTGGPSFKADVLVRDRNIMAIGSFPRYKADTVIYGNESYLVPGFIDMGSNADRYLTLFSSPQHKDFLTQGITTTLIGQCGFSLAPSPYGALHHLIPWTKINAINTNWRSVGEFLDTLEQRLPLGINIGTLVGHRVMREDILNDPRTFRSLSANELRIFRAMLKQTLREGAFGLSTGLGYYPYQETTYHELRALTDIVAEQHGIYTTHLRDEKENLINSIQETIRIAQETSVTTIISHLRPFIGFEKSFDAARALIEEKSAKAHVYFHTNPFSESAVSLDSLIPSFAQEKDREVLYRKLNNPTEAKKIIASFPRLQAPRVIILNAPGMEFLNGKTLAEFAVNRGLTSPKALLELMKITRLRGVIFYENLNAKKIKEALSSPRALISSDSPNFDTIAPEQKPQRSYKTFPEFLSYMQSSHASLEHVISRISGLPAKLMELPKRGIIAIGYAADMVLLNKDMHPTMVMVNGTTVVHEGNFIEPQSGAHIGNVLRKKSA